MADQATRPDDKRADPCRNCRQPARADRDGGGPVRLAARADRRCREVDQDADVHVQSRQGWRHRPHALTEAASRGVEVKLLVDGFGSAATPQVLRRAREAGGEHCVFNPSWGRRYLLRNHQKLIVIDDRTVLIGGANIDATYLEDRGSKHWRDLWLRLDGPGGGAPEPLFRQHVPLVQAAANRSSARSSGWSANIMSGGGRCSGSSAAP